MTVCVVKTFWYETSRPHQLYMASQTFETTFGERKMNDVDISDMFTAVRRFDTVDGCNRRM